MQEIQHRYQILAQGLQRWKLEATFHHASKQRKTYAKLIRMTHDMVSNLKGLFKSVAILTCRQVAVRHQHGQEHQHE